MRRQVLLLVVVVVGLMAAAVAAAGVTISGSVVDAALSPLAGVTVTLEQNGRVVANARTDAAGLFRFVDVAPGDYRVRATRSGLPAFARDLHVSADMTAIKLPIVITRPGDTLGSAETKDKGPNAGGVVGGAAARGSVGTTVTGETPQAAPSVAAPPSPAAQSGRGGGQAAERASIIVEPPIFVRPPYGRSRPGETYARIEPNRFQFVRDQPLSTFGADVDTASYTNVRRFLSSGQLPPRDAVRVEELVNYFRFPYDDPRDGRPIRLTTEVGDCPWAPLHKLVLIGARARASAAREIAGRNIVLLIDVSGSMAPPERLPLIKTALGLFADTLRPDDRLAIVTYAGSSGIALPSTPARQRDVIQRAIANLNAGGSTNGGQGLIMAYRTAREAFIPGGVNRVILATDGDFNVGIVRQGDLLQLIEREKDSGVFLSVFGVGSGNLRDSTMEMLADHGNGHYAYLDSLQEARRVLVREGDATLENVAKDVKFQVEFNPATVGAWKLVGYEDRLLASEEFNDDRKDGGEMGAGHTVTALYEIVPVGVALDGAQSDRPAIDPLKYQRPQATVAPAPIAAPRTNTNEWLTVKARYKTPEGDRSDLIAQPVRTAPIARVQHLPLASAVAEFGLLLRDAPRDTARWDALTRRVEQIEVPASLASDRDGFKELVAIGRGLSRLK